MFSVILPTMWKCPEVTLPEMRKLHDHPMVGEFILINNDRNATPEAFNRADYDKLYYIEPPSNIFVNPAWNIGAEAASNQLIMIQGDDTSVDSYDFLSHVARVLADNDCLVGCGESCYKNHRDTNLRIDNIAYREWGFGCMMFMHKASYKRIPDVLKVWCGDDYLNEWFIRKKEGIKAIKGLPIHTEMSKTTNLPEFNFKFGESDYYNANKERLLNE